MNDIFHVDLVDAINTELKNYQAGANLLKLEVVVVNRQFKFFIEDVEFHAAHAPSGNTLIITTYRNDSKTAIYIHTLTWDGSQNSLMHIGKIFDFGTEYFNDVIKANAQKLV